MTASVQRRALTPFFAAALACLVIAAATGAVLRCALVYGWDLGLPLSNLRHAHSHLMLFGFATPALFLLMASGAAAIRGGRVPRSVGHVLGVTLSLAIVSHPLFARFGYGTVAIGAARLPPAAIVSGLVVLSWYAFAALWVRHTRSTPRGAAMLAWDLALGLLLLSTVATWALPAVRPLGLDPARWNPVLVHGFLDPFSEGWLVLAVLGLAHAERGSGAEGRRSLIVLAVCTPFAFALAVPRALVPGIVHIVASVAALGWGLALLAQLRLLARGPLGRSLRWRLPLALGATAAVAKVVAGVSPWIAWSGMHGLRVLYLHALLFGFVSLAVLGAARRVLGVRAVPSLGAVQLAALALIASLVPLSELWPAAWSGPWSLTTAAVVAIAAAALIGVASFASALRAQSQTMQRMFGSGLSRATGQRSSSTSASIVPGPEPSSR